MSFKKSYVGLSEQGFLTDKLAFSLAILRVVVHPSCIVLSCIVLYLYAYIALLTVNTNKKRVQCERPREKRAVLVIRVAFQANRQPVLHTNSFRLFHCH